MTFEELLKECASGKMPSVIKQGEGCSINTDKNYSEWFHAESGSDKRKKYMSELVSTNILK